MDADDRPIMLTRIAGERRARGGVDVFGEELESDREDITRYYVSIGYR